MKFKPILVKQDLDLFSNTPLTANEDPDTWGWWLAWA